MDSKELGLWYSAIIGSAGFIFFVGLWEVVVRLGFIDPFFLPAPSQVMERALAMTTGKDAVLLNDIRMSGTRVLTGFLLSAVVGVPLGLIMYRRYFTPTKRT